MTTYEIASAKAGEIFGHDGTLWRVGEGSGDIIILEIIHGPRGSPGCIPIDRNSKLPQMAKWKRVAPSWRGRSAFEVVFEPVTPFPEGAKLEYNMSYETFTDNDLPPDWAIQRAIALGGSSDLSDVTVVKSQYPSGCVGVVAFARYIAEHEDPPRTDVDIASDGWIDANLHTIRYAEHDGLFGIARKAFIAGAKWAKEQP